jgi:hypothetical protein
MDQQLRAGILSTGHSGNQRRDIAAFQYLLNHSHDRC